MALNVEAVLAVKTAILTEPNMYSQDIFADRKNPCGSACCLAGWAVWNESQSQFVSASQDNFYDWSWHAGKLFGIDAKTAKTLFNTLGGLWPEPFSTRMFYAKTDKKRAAVAASLLDHLIANDGKL